METMKDRLSIVLKQTQYNNKQASLARKMDISPNYIGKIANGKSINPSMIFLRKLESKAGISMTWFIDGKGPMLVTERDKQPEQAPALWKELKANMEKRINDLEFIAHLYKQTANFLKPDTKKSLALPVHKEVKVIPLRPEVKIIPLIADAASGARQVS